MCYKNIFINANITINGYLVRQLVFETCCQFISKQIVQPTKKIAICSVKTYNRFYNHLIHSAFIKVLYCLKDKKTTDSKTQGLLKS